MWTILTYTFVPPIEFGNIWNQWTINDISYNSSLKYINCYQNGLKHCLLTKQASLMCLECIEIIKGGPISYFDERMTVASTIIEAAHKSFVCQIDYVDIFTTLKSKWLCL